jgi:zinc protease
LIDKPERVQSQVLIGHLGPRCGTPEFNALMPVETAFGGTFTSRMMQEIRVKRGWSYGAGCRIGRARGAHWLRLYLAPSAEQTPDAVELCLKLYDDLRSGGITDEERTFAVAYLTGSMPFSRATASQRLRLQLRHTIFGLPANYADSLPDRLAALQPDDIQRAIEEWLFPDDACVVIVCTAESMREALASRGIGKIEVVAYDSY